MSISVSQWVWDCSRARKGALLVALALADYAREDGSAWPSMAELSRKTRLTPRAIQMGIGDLVKLGELEVGYQHGPKGCNRYRLLMSGAPANISPPQNLRPADFAGGGEMSQVNLPDPANISPPAKSSPPQNLPPPPANFAGGTVKETSTTTKNFSRRSDPNADREDIRRLCSRLADQVQANSFTRPVTNKAALDAARLLIDRDGRTEAQVTAAIDWSQQNAFWLKNIRSMPKLREHYERLQREALDERAGRNGHKPFRNPKDAEAAYEGTM